MTPQSQSNYLSWLREQQVLADKLSKEWSDTYPESRQADYRAGMWFVYRQAEKEFLKEKDDMSEKCQTIDECCGNPEGTFAKFINEHPDIDAHILSEQIDGLLLQKLAAQLTEENKHLHTELEKEKQRVSFDQDATEKLSRCGAEVEVLRAELESALAFAYSVKVFYGNPYNHSNSCRYRESFGKHSCDCHFMSLRALLSTINKEEKK